MANGNTPEPKLSSTDVTFFVLFFIHSKLKYTTKNSVDVFRHVTITEELKLHIFLAK